MSNLSVKGSLSLSLTPVTRSVTLNVPYQLPLLVGCVFNTYTAVLHAAPSLVSRIPYVFAAYPGQPQPAYHNHNDNILTTTIAITPFLLPPLHTPLLPRHAYRLLKNTRWPITRAEIFDRTKCIPIHTDNLCYLSIVFNYCNACLNSWQSYRAICNRLH